MERVKESKYPRGKVYPSRNYRILMYSIPHIVINQFYPGYPLSAVKITTSKVFLTHNEAPRGKPRGIWSSRFIDFGYLRQNLAQVGLRTTFYTPSGPFPDFECTSLWYLGLRTSPPYLRNTRWSKDYLPIIFLS